MSKKNTITNIPKICDICGRCFRLKGNLIKHILIHAAQRNELKSDELTCFKCNIVFKNKGLLVCHNVKVHQSNEISALPRQKIIENRYRHFCQACQVNFFYQTDLKHHIREHHFNLLSHTPYCALKKVNQVWFEKVLNSTNIVEMKKVAQNILLMRKLDDNTAMKVSDHPTDVIDLRELYPTLRSKHIQCAHCLKMYDRCYINKHIKDVHFKYNDMELYKEDV